MAHGRITAKRPGLALLVLGALAPSAGVAAPPLPAAEDRPQLLHPFGADATVPSAEAIERLGQTRTSRAARRLLEWADDGEVRASARLTLRLVRALDHHGRGPLRHEVTLRLLSIFRTSELTSVPTPPLAMDRIRGTAARSLAQNGDALGLRILWAMAAADGELDPSGKRLAREALGRPPESPPDASAQPKNKALAKLIELESAASSEEAVTRLRSWLKQAGPVEDVEWRDALAQPTPIWTLRAIALRATLEPRLAQRATEAATRHLNSPDARLRSASAWTLAIHAPKQAMTLLESADPVVRRAALRQAHSGELAARVRALLVQRLARPTPLSDNELSLLSVALEPGSATPRPAELEAGLARSSHDLAWKAGLSSWVSDGDFPSRGPDVGRVRGWLGADDPAERAAAALGLGRAPDRLAAPLVAEAYFEEMDPVVRRALVFALRQHPGPGAERILREAASIDPDGHCRALASRQGDDMGPNVANYALAAVTMNEGVTGSPLWLQHFQTLSGRSLSVAADPDGFIGVVGEKFAVDGGE